MNKILHIQALWAKTRKTFWKGLIVKTDIVALDQHNSCQECGRQIMTGEIVCCILFGLFMECAECYQNRSGVKS